MTDQILRDATCAGCGCACDDIDLTVRDGRIAQAERACPLGEAWFAADAPVDAPACLVAGRPASLEQALDRAAEILTAARYPLVYGLTQTSCEAAQLAVGIADWIGGVVDTPGGTKGAIGGGSFPAGGEVTCSLGEIANRADLILVWRANPVVTHPRHFSRYSLEPRGRFVPGGRADRTLIVVDSRQTETAAAADRFVSLGAAADFEALWILRALVRGNAVRPADVLAATGLPLDSWQALADRLKQARFAVFLFDHQLPAGSAGHATADALWCLVRDLNAHTRAAATVLSAHGNSAGAAGVISWRCAHGGGQSGPGLSTIRSIGLRRRADSGPGRSRRGTVGRLRSGLVLLPRGLRTSGPH